MGGRENKLMWVVYVKVSKIMWAHVCACDTRAGVCGRVCESSLQTMSSHVRACILGTGVWGSQGVPV